MANIMTDEQHISKLENGLSYLNCPESIAPKLLKYLRQLQHWNKAYNLTAIRDIQDMIHLHVLDSLAVHPWLHGETLLDVGSGAGLPGIPLALLKPDMRICLLDSNGKKTRFLTQMKAMLALDNVSVVHCRLEHYSATYDTVVSRAFTSLANFCDLAGPCCNSGGRLLALKGNLHEAELNAIPDEYYIKGIHNLKVPSLDAERHLVHVESK